MTTVTAVVCAYWPERFPNVKQIVSEILGGQTRPDNIIVFNNNPYEKLDDIQGACVINSGKNFTSRSKYAVATLEPSDYYLLLDDDIGVKPLCLSACLSMAYPGCCFSDWGVKMTSNFITEGIQHTSISVQEMTSVDAFVGRFQFVSLGAIANMFAAEVKVRLPHLPEYRSISEDHLIAMTNDSYVIPLAEEENLTSQPMGSQSMQFDPLYGTVREIFAYQTWIALGNQPFKGKHPVDNGVTTEYAEYLRQARES